MNTKYPKLMAHNFLSIQIEGCSLNWSITDAPCWPCRGELKQVGNQPKLYLYASDGTLLLESNQISTKLPGIFGLAFKRVTHTEVSLKNKVQNICAIMTSFSLLNIEDMDQIPLYDN